MGIDILFIIPPFHMRNGGGSFFPLGIGYIISEVELAGFTWKVLDCTKYIHSFYADDLERLSIQLKEELSKVKPSVIGIGPCITTQLRALKVISDACQQVLPNTPVFAGGPLASIENQDWVFYEELGIPYLIKGDGEKAVVDAIRIIKNGHGITSSSFISYSGSSYTNFIDDINSIPFPYRGYSQNDSFSVRRVSDATHTAAMVTSRGCPYACNYCVSGNLKHNNIHFRKRSIENILDEMQMLHQQYGINDIVFYDDCFFPSAKTINLDVFNFCEALIERRLQITWQVEMRPDAFCELSDDALQKLCNAGCRQINLGIEKISRRGLAFLGKPNSWPYLESKIRHIKNLSSISLSATFILGGDNETEDDVISLIKQTTELPLDYAHYNPLFIYPGTPIYNAKFSDKREWAQAIFEDDLPWGEIVYENSQLTRDRLIELVDYAYSEFYKKATCAEQQMVADRFNLKRKQ